MSRIGLLSWILRARRDILPNAIGQILPIHGRPRAKKLSVSGLRPPVPMEPAEDYAPRPPNLVRSLKTFILLLFYHNFCVVAGGGNHRYGPLATEHLYTATLSRVSCCDTLN